MGTLRHALANAVDGDTINFSLTTPATIALTGGQLVVDKGVTIEGPGQDQLTVDGQQASRVFYIAPGKTVAISGLTIANGEQPFSGGGGVYNAGTLTLEDCTLTNNTAFGAWHSNTDIVYAKGGAIRVFVDLSGEGHAVSLTVNRCTLSDNTAIGDVDPSAGESTERGIGGGIFVGASQEDGAPPVTVTVTVTDSTLVGNTAWGTVEAYGGAIAIGEVDDDPEQVGVNVIIRNSTLTGNSAVGGLEGQGAGWGGAISNFLGSLTIDNSTLAGNYDNWEDLSTPLGGAIVNALGTLKIKNTILANDSPDTSPNVNDLNPLLGEESGVDDLGFNLCTDDCSGLLDHTETLLNIDPMLGLLADNGGPTQTHALLAGSPAIDAADDTDSAGDTVAFDQRGVARPQGSANDIGAFESECVLPYSWSGVLQPINADGSSVFKAGSTVPVKFRLTGCSAGIVDLQATLSYTMISGYAVGSVNESVSTSSATSGNLFRYDPTSGQYVFTWSTKGLSRGTYRLFIDLGDGVERTVDLGLR